MNEFCFSYKSSAIIASQLYCVNRIVYSYICVKIVAILLHTGDISCDKLYSTATISFLCILAAFLVVSYNAYRLKRISDILYWPHELTNFVLFWWCYCRFMKSVHQHLDQSKWFELTVISKWSELTVNLVHFTNNTTLYKLTSPILYLFHHDHHCLARYSR